MTRLNSNGFTLIELLIVIAMISILTTMALPSFQNQIVRTQVQEAIALSEFVRKDIQTFYQEKKRLPLNNTETGIPEAKKIIGNFVESIHVDEGSIHVSLGNRVNKNAAGKIISIRPALVPDEPQVPISWVYGYASAPNGMKVVGTNKTSVPSQFLPVNCRF